MPKGPRKFQFLVDATGLTRFGGLILFHQFCKSLGVRHFLQLYARWPAYPYRDYQPVDLFLAHVVAIVAGIGRIENTQSLLHNGLIPPLLGLADFPHRDTLRTFLWGILGTGTSMQHSSTCPQNFPAAALPIPRG